MALYIGLMSGTSLDGIDAVLVDFEPGHALVRTHRHAAFGGALRAELLALNQAGPDELHRAALAANQLARLSASLVASMVGETNRHAVIAIGAHGQTVRHRPGEFDGCGYTVQIQNGALLADLTGIDVVCDFRSADVAAGGQGAPLVPAFHSAMFGHAGEDRAVLNLGGIANLTLLAADGRVGGFDCGPANLLLDAWCARHCGSAFDAGGAWAASGRAIDALLAELLSEPFFALPSPKSTGRDLFSLEWLERKLLAHAPAAAPQDVQATLAELTARSAADALTAQAPRTTTLAVCGGGANNSHLMQRLRAQLPTVRVGTTAQLHGLPVDQVEAAAFAWLAQRFIGRVPGNIVGVTGARAPRVLGAFYPSARPQP